MVRLAAAAAHSRRLSASFFSLGIPGEEQEVRGVSGVVVVLWESVVDEVVEVGVVVLEPSASVFGGSGAQVFPLRLFKSCGGFGLRKVSLLTEMNALPGVEKGRGP